MFDAAFVARFLSRIAIAQTGCWLWTAGTDRKGYGAISYHCRMLKAHRVAFLLEYGRWPMPCALHACDTPACVRVGHGHIFEGTPADNSADMVHKGRASHLTGTRGIDNPASKVTIDTVCAIRELRQSGLSLRKIAARVGITNSQVHNIASGKHWGWA